MPLWSWWLSAAALAAVPIAHWLVLDRGLAVSGRYSALIDRLRFGAPEQQDETELDQAAMVEALRAMTAEQFGDEALADAAPSLESSPPAPAARSSQGPLHHIMFLGGLVLGGTLSALLASALDLEAGLRGEAFAAVVSQLQVPAPALLIVGGMFVGFGTRMAAGCTSGHGLCGVSQLQAGSLTATAAFFGAGVATSLGLGALL